jgi:hypothetical protein
MLLSCFWGLWRHQLVHQGPVRLCVQHKMLNLPCS